MYAVQDVVILLSMMCGEDLQKKLKLLYCLHLPGVVHPSELEQVGNMNCLIDKLNEVCSVHPNDPSCMKPRS